MMQKRKHIEWGQVLGAVIFIAIFVGLIFLGLYVDNGGQFDSNFFEDVGKTMEGQY